MALGMGGIGVAVGNDLGGVGYSVGFDVLMLTQRQRSAKLKRYRKQQSKLAWKRDDASYRSHRGAAVWDVPTLG